MDIEIIKVVGQVAGIGGISLGVFLVLFRSLINKDIFPSLTKEHSYNLLKIIVFLVFGIAVIGILAWVYIQIHDTPKHEKIVQITTGQSSPVISNVQGNIIVNTTEEKQ